MSPKGGKTSPMESLRLKIHEHMTSVVGEDILCVLDKHTTSGDVCRLRVFVLERLSAAAQFMVNLFQKEMETLETLLEKQNKLLDIDFDMDIEQHNAEVSTQYEKWRSSLVQEEPQPPHINEEQEEEADVSSLTLLHWETSCDTLSDQCMESRLQVKMNSPDSARDISIKRDEPEDISINLEEAEYHLHLNQCVESRLQVKMNSPDSAKDMSIKQEEPEDISIKQEEPEDISIKQEEPEDISLTQEEPEDISLKQEEPEDHPNRMISTEHHRERSTVSREMASQRHSTFSEEQPETDEGRGPFDAMMQPVVKLYRIAAAHLPVCKEEVFNEQQERSSSLVQEEPQPPQIKEEQEELLQRPEESDESMLTLLAVKSEDGHDDENRETEPVAGTSTQHLKTQADVEDCGTSQPTSDGQLLSSHCSESDTEDSAWENSEDQSTEYYTEDSDDWLETSEGQSTSNTLKSHKTQHVEGQRLSLSSKLSQDLTSSKQTPSMRTHTGEKPFICDVCGKGCSQDGDLKNHMRTHTGEKPFTCHVCGKGYARNVALKEHFISIHFNSSLTCEVCGEGFPTSCHLKSHMKKHTGGTCSLCGRGCVSSRQLKIHMRTHMGIKPFPCNVCGKGFAQQGYLKSHMHIHTGEKPFPCNVCGKGFAQQGYLKIHMHSHTGEKPFTCNVCGKGCTQIGQLKVHMRIHTGEKPFTCNVCGKGFSQIPHLNKHMKTHTGEKPLTCNMCGKDFAINRDLKNHTCVNQVVQLPSLKAE